MSTLQSLFSEEIFNRFMSEGVERDGLHETIKFSDKNFDMRILIRVNEYCIYSHISLIYDTQDIVICRAQLSLDEAHNLKKMWDSLGACYLCDRCGLYKNNKFCICYKDIMLMATHVEDEQVVNCSLCLEKLAVMTDSIFETECGHKFHRRCFSQVRVHRRTGGGECNGCNETFETHEDGDYCPSYHGDIYNIYKCPLCRQEVKLRSMREELYYDQSRR